MESKAIGARDVAERSSLAWIGDGKELKWVGVSELMWLVDAWESRYANEADAFVANNCARELREMAGRAK